MYTLYLNCRNFIKIAKVMKREERKDENKILKDWKKPELKVLDKGKTFSGATPDVPEETEGSPFGS